MAFVVYLENVIRALFFLRVGQDFFGLLKKKSHSSYTNFALLNSDRKSIMIQCIAVQ